MRNYLETSISKIVGLERITLAINKVKKQIKTNKKTNKKRTNS